MINTVISEEDFDDIPIQKEGVSPDINLGSHLPNPLSTSMNVHIAPPKKNMAEVSNINVQNTDKRIDGHGAPPAHIILKAAPDLPGKLSVGAAWVEKKSEVDRINNVTQKESAMVLAGVTRRKTYQVIARLLEAKKWEEVTDKGGNVRWERVEDLEKQRQGAEMALKVMGDMIEHKQVEYGIADTTLEKLKALSVADLKMRASELLEGRRKVVDITDAVVVK